MSGNNECPIWGTPATTSEKDYGNIIRVDSPRTGGTYVITEPAAARLKKLDLQTKARITTWLTEQRRLGVDRPTIDVEALDELVDNRALSPWERADRLLSWIQKCGLTLGSRVPFTLPDQPREKGEFEVLAWTESTAPAEVRFLAEALTNKGWIDIHRSPGGQISCLLTLDGFSRLQEIETKAVNSKQAFVAMWFNDETATVRNIIKQSILDTGYEPRIIDEKPHNNKIDDEIIAEIRRSRFLVADFTHGKEGMRGGVYYEAGFARGLGLEVISTCRQDLLGENKIHFDTRQYNHIGWEPDKLDDFKKALSDRISATIGDGPLKVR